MVTSNAATTFSRDHLSARQRFRQAASHLGWQLESFPISATGPDGEELAFDVACSPGSDPEKVLVVSSGVHGVEGFFGSAVQVALLEQWSITTPPPTKCVFIHGLNAFGFAWLRRFDENNVDLNRNFLLPDERFIGAPDGYAELNHFLNPHRPPSRWEPFTLKALRLIAKHGIPALRQAIAAGQHDFPQGLFFAGNGPSHTQRRLDENMPRWLRDSKHVVHLDYHTGLGRSGACKLLIDYTLSDTQRRWLTDWFGADSFEACNSSGISYDARGGFGRWCISRKLAPNYLFACAEFGTYGSVQVLSGLRAENQAHHWGDVRSPSTLWAKQRLKELFCPASIRWRWQVVELGKTLVHQAQQGLLQVAPS